MDLEALRRSPIGRLEPISGTDVRRGEVFDYFAYVPAELPHEVALSQAAWKEVAHASAALARLDQAGQLIPDAHLLRRPTLRREAQSTSALEGTHAAFTELLELELVDEDGPRGSAVREVNNYVRAAENAYEWIAERPITGSLLCQLQKILVSGTSGELADAGRLREQQVFIGPRSARVDEARFVPPPPGDALRAGFEDWLAWVERPSDLPAVVRAAIAHYQFETLHPFSDGNGRIGRLVVVLQLMRYGELREPLLIVSPWFEVRRRDYQDGMLALSQTGDWSTWVEFFARGVHEQALETHRQAEHLLGFREAVRDRVREGGLRGVAAQIAEDLIAHPVVTPTWAATAFGVSYQAANTGIKKLVELGLLIEITGKRYRRLFASPSVLGALGVVELQPPAPSEPPD